MEIVKNSDRAIPITIITGFLGAGKTTLLNRILNGNHGLRVAVLVNDFGSINIDAELIIGVKDCMISLDNGCICCQIRDDLIKTVDEVISRPEGPEYILLEASGVADPAGIFATFNSSKFRDRIRLDSVTCVIDADQVFAFPKYPTLMELKLRQIGFADMVILNKVDLAGKAKVGKVGEWIDNHFNRIRMLETNYCDVPYEILIGVGCFDPAPRLFSDKGPRSDDDHHHRHQDHGQTFSTWSYKAERPLSMEAVCKMAKKLPGNIYRCKGVVYVADAPQRRAVLQVVGRRTDIALHDEWGGRKPHTQIVAIGALGSINAVALREQFDSCLSEGT